MRRSSPCQIAKGLLPGDAVEVRFPPSLEAFRFTRLDPIPSYPTTLYCALETVAQNTTRNRFYEAECGPCGVHCERVS